MLYDGTSVNKRRGRVHGTLAAEQDVLSLNQLHFSIKVPVKDLYPVSENEPVYTTGSRWHSKVDGKARRTRNGSVITHA